MEPPQFPGRIKPMNPDSWDRLRLLSMSLMSYKTLLRRTRFAVMPRAVAGCRLPPFGADLIAGGGAMR
jgi:hypothetical protein